MPHAFAWGIIAFHYLYPLNTIPCSYQSPHARDM